MKNFKRRTILKGVSVASAGLAVDFNVSPVKAKAEGGEPERGGLAIYNNSTAEKEIRVEVRKDPTADPVFSKTISLAGRNSPSRPSKEACRFLGKVQARDNFAEYTVEMTDGSGKSDRTSILVTPNGILNDALISGYVFPDGEIAIWTSID